MKKLKILFDVIKSQTLQVGNPQTGEQLHYTGSSAGVRVLSLTSGLGVWHQEEESLEHLLLKAGRAWVQELHSWRAHTKSHVHQDPRQKEWLNRSLGQIYLLGWAGLLGWCRAAVVHWSSPVTSWGASTGVCPGGCHLGTKTWPHPTACRLQCWDILGQTTNRLGIQPHSPAVKLPNDFLSP